MRIATIQLALKESARIYDMENSAWKTVARLVISHRIDRYTIQLGELLNLDVPNAGIEESAWELTKPEPNILLSAYSHETFREIEA